MINSFRAWNKILRRYEYFEFKDLEKKENIQWHILEFEQSTGLFDKWHKEIFEGDFYRIEYPDDMEIEMDYYIVTWIKEWCMFATLSSGEFVNYQDNGVKALDSTMYWTFPLHDSEKEIEIIGSIRERKHRRKLNNYLFHDAV